MKRRVMKINRLNKKIQEIDPSLVAREYNGSIVLSGEVDDWSKVVKAGQTAVDKKRYLGVVNDIKLRGFEEKPSLPNVEDDALDGRQVDVLIVGGGISGCAAAREFSRYDLNTLVLEKGSDVAVGQSSRNGGVVHTGISFSKSSLKLKYCLAGNELYTKLSEEMDVPLHRYGQIMFVRKPYEVLLAKVVRLIGTYRGVPDIRYCPREELKRYEPAVPDWAVGGIYMPSGGLTCPYRMTIALAENAAKNGAEFSFETVVTGMKVADGRITEVQTNRGTVYPKVVVNAAGMYSDKIAEMAGDRTFTIHPRKGSYMVIDKKKGDWSKTSMAKAPFTISPYQDAEIDGSLPKTIQTILANLHSHSKGTGVIHTVDNNILLGPEALEVPDRESMETDRTIIDELFKAQHEIVPDIQKSDIITFFSGVRSATYEEDFVVRQGLRTKNIFEMSGIQSPGLTAAPAIAQDIVAWAVDFLKSTGEEVNENTSFDPIHKFSPEVRYLPDEERNVLIRENPDYGEIVCRCEEISKGEIIAALSSSLPVYTLDAVKRRVRPGMGRCQGGFCSPQVMRIISEVSGKDFPEISKGSVGSTILYERTK